MEGENVGKGLGSRSDWVKMRASVREPEQVEKALASDEEIKDALEIIEKDQILADDSYAREVVEAGGKVERGDKVVIVDLKNFLQARASEVQLQRMIKIDPVAVWVAQQEAMEDRLR